MGTRYQGSEEEIRALNAYIKLMRATDSLTARIHKHLADAGLTVSQFGVLEMLFHLGPLPQRDIAKKLLKSGGNITMVIDNLEKRRLAERRRGTEDRRMITVHLTEEGRGLVAEIFPRHLKTIVSEMKNLTPAEQEELDRICRKLGLKSERG